MGVFLLCSRVENIYHFTNGSSTIEVKLTLLSEFHKSGLQCVQSVVSTNTHCFSSKDLSTALTHDDRTSNRCLSVVKLGTKIFWL